MTTPALPLGWEGIPIMEGDEMDGRCQCGNPAEWFENGRPTCPECSDFAHYNSPDDMEDANWWPDNEEQVTDEEMAWIRNQTVPERLGEI